MFPKDSPIIYGLPSSDLPLAQGSAKFSQKPDAPNFAAAMQAGSEVRGSMAPMTQTLKAPIPGLPSESDILAAVKHTSVKPNILGAATVSPEILTASLNTKLEPPKNQQLTAMRDALQQANLSEANLRTSKAGTEIRGQMMAPQSSQAMVPVTAQATAQAAQAGKSSQATQVTSKSVPNPEKSQAQAVATNATPPNSNQAAANSNQAAANPPLIGIALNRSTAGISRGIALRAEGSILRDGRPAGIAIVMPERSVQNVALNRDTPAVQKANKAAASNKAQITDIGSLAAQYESGSEGIAAIGYDRTGGTSYGKYQIASLPGSMDGFIDFLEREQPDFATRLQAAGPSNTGSRKGKMPEVWRQIAAENPQRFEALQEKYIHESHYQPALAAVEKMGYKVKNSKAMQEVLWSTAVQHGPAGATRIYAQVADNINLTVAGKENQEKRIINDIYDLRATRFGSSTSQIQTLARERMESEKRIALTMVSKKQKVA